MGAAGAALAAWPAVAQEYQQSAGGLVVREAEPRNLEYRFESLKDEVLTNSQFYVRNHFPQPRIDPARWTLRVEGAVSRPFELSYAELLRLPTEERLVLLECAGNNRAYLQPPAKGVQWGMGAVGVANWSGVSLARLLRRAGLRSSAVEVVLEGADRGRPADAPVEISYARGIPVTRAMDGTVLVAHAMNGAPLTGEHGAPARGLVPGWYGMASVKWLTRIRVLDQAFRGHFQTVDYTFWDQQDGLDVLRPLAEIQPKAQIAQPIAGSRLSAGSRVRVHGAAWTGQGTIERVQVSADSGRTWSPARLAGTAREYAWQFWEWDWRPITRGGATLMARATDSRGREQPLTRDSRRKNYMITHVVGVPVEVA